MSPRRAVGRVVRVVTSVLVLGCLALAAIPLYGTLSGRYRLLPVLSGSMQPQMERGDLAWVEPLPREQLKVGDVLVFNSPARAGTASKRVIHRVTELVDPTTIRADQVRPGVTYVRTKGDNNPEADPWIAGVDGDTVWVRTKVVRDLGRPLLAAGDAGAKVFALFAAALLLVVYAVQTLVGALRPVPRTAPAGPVAAPVDAPVPVAASPAAAPRRLGLTVGTVAVAALVVGAGGLAAAVSAALRDDEVTATAVGTGAVTVALRGSTLDVVAADLLPGDEAVRFTELRNDGDVALGVLQLEVTATGGGALLAPTGGLQVRVERCAVAWVGSGAGATCGAGATTIVGDRPALGRTDLPLGAMGVASPGGADHLRVALRLPDDADPALAGASATVTVRFLARQRSGTVR